MIPNTLNISKQILIISKKQIKYIIGLIILSLCIIYFPHYYSVNIQFSVRNISSFISNKSSESTLSSSLSSRELLLLYQHQLSHIETTSFRPTFHNHYLKLKLNLTSIATEHLDYFKNYSTTKTSHLKIICLQSSKNINDFRSVCDIYLTFQVKILNSEKVQLTLLSKNASCSILLTNTTHIILIKLQQVFSVDDIFRFTYQWPHFAKKTEIFWRLWPLNITCLISLQCSFTNILAHSTSKELFLKEQNGVSSWLDLQYETFIDQRLSKQINNSRNLVPFEIAKNRDVCSSEFQNWILDYEKWHENISFNLNNGFMTVEEQRDRIIELNVRLLIYEKPDTSGIADRIIHMISTYLVALLTKRLFIFDKNWSEFTDIMQSSLNYEQNLIIPWIQQLDLLNKNLSKTHRNYLSSNSRWFSLDRFQKDYDYDKIFPERILTFRGHTGGVIQTIRSSSSIYKKFLTVDLRMHTDNMFGCLYQSLFTYKLSELINRVPFSSSHVQMGHSSQFILQTLLSPIFYPVGVQIRAGDATMNEKNIYQSKNDSNSDRVIGKYQNFFTCAQQIIRKNEKLFHETNRTPVIFLLSDNLEIRRAALKRWQFSFECSNSSDKECRLNSTDLHILSSSDPVFHVSQTTNRMLAFQLGMFDIFLYSLCEQHLISVESGFGRFSAFASLRQRNIYSLNLNENKSCSNNSLPLSSAGYQWSGI
ncbi:unnamed protein product [Adineta steineri]|uniref:Uncharacterized protein n=4 Tax=Adineta steineri TaxID=433720 RepID=A0A815TFG2_9BILA|nr:unnamed protein product [Adineta steineri]